MKNDIFIDTNVAKNFGNPLDDDYKNLITWLLKHNPKDKTKDAHLVISQKLFAEYVGSSIGAASQTNIAALVAQLTQQGRLKKISKEEIAAFKSKHFSTAVQKRLVQLRLKKDEEHLPVVLLSYRKFALVIDSAFRTALEEFPGFTGKIRVESRPKDLPYAEDWSSK